MRPRTRARGRRGGRAGWWWSALPSERLLTWLQRVQGASEDAGAWAARRPRWLVVERTPVRKATDMAAACAGCAQGRGRVGGAAAALAGGGAHSRQKGY